MISQLFIITAIWAQIPHIDIVRSICWVESRHRASAINRFDGGSPSYGICQIKLETANFVRRYYKISDRRITAKKLMKVDVNIFYATMYFKYQWNRYRNVKKAVSAYNAGRAIKSNGKYVKMVLKRIGND